MKTQQQIRRRVEILLWLLDDKRRCNCAACRDSRLQLEGEYWALTWALGKASDRYEMMVDEMEMTYAASG